MYELYEADNSFEGEEGIFYIIAGQGGSARRSNDHKYYIITQSIAGIYNADEDKMVKGILAATWKRPLAVARDFIQNIETKDNEARTFIASVNELYEAALDWLDEDCEISFSTPEEFAAALSDRLKYIFVNQNGSYTIGYDDGCVFGGHEIDVDVNTKGRFVCAEMR